MVLVPPTSIPPTIPCTDRTSLVSKHQGNHVLPNSQIFSRLLRHSHRNRKAVVDVNLGVERSYADLISDVIQFRQVMESSLSRDTLRRLEEGEEIYIGILAAGGYEFTVGIIAVLAIGAAAVPMTVASPVEEIAYFVEKSRQVLIVTSSHSDQLGQSVGSYMTSQQKTTGIPCVPVLSSLSETRILPSDVLISSDRYLDDNAAGVVIFTSGTTGPPKGSVMRRAFVHDCSLELAETYNVTHEDVILHVLPVHHATGIGINFFPFLISGACIEFRSGSLDVQWMWERWKRGGLTFFSGVPTVYIRMMRFYEQHLAKLPMSEREGYIEGARQFRAMLCGSSALPKPIQDFWSRLRNGTPILTRYGATEFGSVCKVPLDPVNVPDGSVGPVCAGVDLRLSEGNEGEVLVKSPWMFSKYLFDDKATEAAHNSQGYFRTGDIARREGQYLWIVGRASLDIIKSGGYKISALDIERECLGLPYVSEVMVVPVPDAEFGHRVGAVITLRDDQELYSFFKDNKLTIDDLRRDLRGRIAGYKLPTVLRVLEAEIPKGQSGKVLKKILGPLLFPVPGWDTNEDIQVWSRKKEKLVMASKL